MTVSESVFRQGLLDASVPVPDGLMDGDGRAAGRRYSVYRNNVAVSLREALAAGFPAVERLIGEENFARVAGVYLRQEQPGSPLMMHYGAGFPAFLESFAPLSHLGYLPDVARLDLMMRQSYHAADAAPVDPSVLQGLDDDRLARARLRLAPSARLLRSAWPVLSIWRFTMEPDRPKPVTQAEDVLILRHAFDPAPHLLPPGGAIFLSTVMAGKNFGAAMQAAGDDFEIGRVIGLLLENGALVALDIEGDD